MNDDEEALDVWLRAAESGDEGLRGFDVPAILNVLITDLRAAQAALKEAELALRAWQWAIADKGAPVGDSEMSLNLSADAIRRSNAELVLKAEAMTDAALARIAEVRK